MKNKLLCIGTLVAALLGCGQEEEPSKKRVTIRFDSEAARVYKKGMARMERAGANFRADQLYCMLTAVDANKNRNIELEEANELYNFWLNPDDKFGRLALPYNGPEIQAPDESTPRYNFPLHPEITPEFAPWVPYINSMTDENNDGKISMLETKQTAYKINQGE